MSVKVAKYKRVLAEGEDGAEERGVDVDLWGIVEGCDVEVVLALDAVMQLDGDRLDAGRAYDIDDGVAYIVMYNEAYTSSIIF